MGSISIDTTTQRFTTGPQPAADILVLHTTEGMSWPGYQSGGTAPHATIRPLPGKGIAVREHIGLSQYAKALMNLPGGVETNRRGVIQYELMGTCDPKHRGQAEWYYWPDADPVVIQALADYLRPYIKRFNIPLVAPAFAPYPASYGRGPYRMTGAEWSNFRGICGHQSVPENDHGDPGAFPIGALLKALGAPGPVPVDERLDPKAQFRAFQKALGVPVSQVYDRDTKSAYQLVLDVLYVKPRSRGPLSDAEKRRFQRIVGVVVDGDLGPESLKAGRSWVARLQKRIVYVPCDGVLGVGTHQAVLALVKVVSS